jgi:curved DNA-binding protein CbpA
MNPYQEWLNCKSKRPHYFELLGVSPKESDEGRIRRAAASRLATVRQVRPGDHIEQWQALIDEIGRAEKILLDPPARRAYVQKILEARQKKVASDKPAAADAVTPPPTPSSKSAPSSPPSSPPLPPESNRLVEPPDPQAVSASPPEQGEDEAFDPMAPLTAPSDPTEREPAAHPAPVEGLSASHSPGLAPSSGSSNFAKFARERARKKRQRFMVTSLLSLLVIGLLGTVGYLNKDAILGPTLSENDSDENDSPSSDPPKDPEPIVGDDGAEASQTPEPPSDNESPKDESTDGSQENKGDPENKGDNVEPDGSNPEAEPSENSAPDTSPPEEKMEEPEVVSKTLTRSQAFELGETMKASHVAISERDFEEAEELWNSARGMAEGTDYAELVDRLQIMGQTTRRCWDRIAQATSQLQSTEVLEFSPTVAVAIIEASEEKLVYRVNGERQERAPRELPPGLAKLILETVLEPGADLDTLLGALYAGEAAFDESKREEAEMYWREVDAAGGSVQDLLLWVIDDYDLVGEDFDPEPVPEQAMLDAATVNVEEELAELISAAKKPADRVATGLEIIKLATTQEATPETYVKFQKACELIAMSGQSSQLVVPLERWEQWFDLDHMAVMTDLLELCSRIAAEPDECKETVRLALELAKQAINKKKPEIAESLLESAMDAAQKSKDTTTRSETLLAVRQLKARLKGM